MYYELLKSSETIIGNLYQKHLMSLSRALKDKRSQCNEKHDKVILQHDNARSHVAKLVKTYLETLKWEVLSHPPYSPDIAPSDYHLFRSMAWLTSTYVLMKKLKIGSICGSPQKMSSFFEWDSYAVRKVGESSRQQWTIF